MSFLFIYQSVVWNRKNTRRACKYLIIKSYCTFALDKTKSQGKYLALRKDVDKPYFCNYLTDYAQILINNFDMLLQHIRTGSVPPIHCLKITYTPLMTIKIQNLTLCTRPICYGLIQSCTKLWQELQHIWSVTLIENVVW